MHPSCPRSPQLTSISLLPTWLVCITQLITVGFEFITSTQGEGIGMQRPPLHPGAICSIPLSVETRCLQRPLGPAQECSPGCSRSFCMLPLPAPCPQGDVQHGQLSDLRWALSTCGNSHWQEGLPTDAYGGRSGLGNNLQTPCGSPGVRVVPAPELLARSSPPPSLRFPA